MAEDRFALTGHIAVAAGVCRLLISAFSAI